MLPRGFWYVESFKLAICAGPGEGVALVLVSIVVVEAVVATVELTVDWRQVLGGRVDAVAFRQAIDVAMVIAVGAIMLVLGGVEGRIGCCALRESVS